MFVRNAWYVAAWDHEVGRSMFRRIVLDERKAEDIDEPCDRLVIVGHEKSDIADLAFHAVERVM